MRPCAATLPRGYAATRLKLQNRQFLKRFWKRQASSLSMSTPFIASNNQKNNKHKTIIFLQKSLKLVSSSLVTLLFVRYVKANVDFLVQIVHMKARKENLLLFYTWASRKNTLKKFWSKERKTTVIQPDKWIPGKLFMWSNLLDSF